MCKRLIFLISFVLVLSLGTVAQAAVPDPVSFWRFEGDYTDEMGVADGTAEGTATIVNSDRGLCLELDGDGWVDIPSGVTELGNLDFSIGAWMKWTGGEVAVGEIGGCILSKSNGDTGWTSNEKQFFINEEDAGEGGFDGTATYVGWGADWIRGGQRVDDGAWHHVCVTWDHEGAEGHVYVDGVDDTNEVTYFEGQGDNAGNTVRIGFSPGQHSVNFEGWIDDVAIFDVTLTAEEVFELAGGRRGASNPIPSDVEPRVDPDGLVLWWTKDPGATPSMEHVYFSHDFDEVNDRTVGADQGIQDANYWPTTGDLNDDVNLGQTYFWRIDEVIEGEAAPGLVWQFTVKTAQAGLPDPEDGGIAGPCPTLEWDPGYGAVTHNVYFDVNEARVAARNMDPCATLNEPTAESYTPGTLEWDTTYYWAVDEVNEGDVCTPGEVWYFTVGSNPATDAPVWRSRMDTLYTDWAFDANFVADGNLFADTNWIEPNTLPFEPNCVDLPDGGWLTSYTGGTGTYSGVADNNEGFIRLKHTDNARAGQNVIVRAAVISYPEPPNVEFERITGWGPGEEEAEGTTWQNEAESELLYSFELCDGWWYSVYEVEFLTVDPADNIHVNVANDGEMYLDSVKVDAYWYTPPEATGPRPPDEPDEEEDPEGFSIFPKISLIDCTQLIWYPGVWADKHDVYLSSSFADVNTADADDPCGPESNYTYKGRIDVNVYPDGDCLELAPATTYFWRIDEVNDACDPCLWRGTIWSFTTSDFRVIEDFEIYVDTSGPGEPNLLSVWEDWTTLWPDSAAEAKLSEQGVTSPGTVNTEYGGTKAMQFVYDASWGKPLYVIRTWAQAQNWAKGGFVALWLYFNGEDYNKNDGMSLTLGDTDGHKKTIEYDNPHSDVNDVNDDVWHQWGVALEDFNVGATPVEPNRINYLELRVLGATGTGTIFFDDLRLYVRRCLPDESRLRGDIAGSIAGEPDCFVDEWDLDAMFEDWLVGDANVVSVAPGDANLLVEYLFDPCAAYDDLGDPWDSSGNGNHGSNINDVNIHGGMLTLENVAEVNDFNAVEIPLDANTFNKPFSIVMKVRVEPGSVLFASCPPTPNDPCETSESYGSYDHAMAIAHGTENEFGTDNIFRDHSYIGNAGNIDQSGAADGEWHTVATTSDGSSGQITYLITGTTELRSNENPDFPEEGPQIWLPERHKVMIGYTYHPAYNDPANADYFGTAAMNGDVEELRIYNRVLSVNEIVNLSGVTAGNTIYLPVDSDADLYQDEPAATSLQSTRWVNFKDYTRLMENWLEDLKWPPAE